MKPIAEITDALRDVPRALVPSDSDPWIRPVIRGQATEASGTSEVVVDISEGWDYPDWVEPEIWEALDRDVFDGPESPDASTRAVGIDALAWYVSFHYTGDGPWGIFIPLSSLAYFENRVFTKVRAVRERKWRLAYDALLAHEQMHFAVDYACAQWEVLLSAPSWAGMLNRRRAEHLPYLPVEEQVANAFMLRCAAVWKPKSFEHALQAFVAKQPAGYSDGLSATDRDAFGHCMAEVIKAYTAVHTVERGLNATVSAYDHAALVPTRETLTQCPVHIVHDENRIGVSASVVRLITQICNIRESDHFQRRFARLDHTTQRNWSAMKQKLSVGVPRSARLEKMRGLPGNVFSVRIGDNFRVHLQQQGDEGWEATDIGSHKEMGHG